MIISSVVSIIEIIIFSLISLNMSDESMT